MPVTPVYIICSPRPLVGKTLIARLLSEFLLLKNGTVNSFDINLKEPSLLDYLPRTTETADVIDTYGKMQLMDRLIVDDGIAKVIDLGFHAFDEFFKMTGRDRFPEGSRPPPCRAGDPVRGRRRSRLGAGLSDAAAADPAERLITVDNEHVVRGELPTAMEGGRVLRISALPTFLKTYVDRLSFSFTGYLRNEKDSSTELHQWIRRNYSSFRDLELSLLLQGS